MSDIDREYTVTDAPVRSRADLERDLREAKRVLRVMAGDDASFAPRLAEAAEVLIRALDRPTRLEREAQALLHSACHDLRFADSNTASRWAIKMQAWLAAYDRKRKGARRGRTQEHFA